MYYDPDKKNKYLAKYLELNISSIARFLKCLQTTLKSKEKKKSSYSTHMIMDTNSLCFPFDLDHFYSIFINKTSKSGLPS